MCSPCRASTLKAGSTVRLEVKVSLIPFCEWPTSWSQFSRVISLTPSGGLAMMGTGYRLISASEMSPAMIILSAVIDK